MKFIHAADLHIDSPLQGLERYEGAPVEALRSATRRALENLVRLALEERVAFVIVAGDLFDGQWPNVGTGLWTREQFRRLEREGIDLYLLRGNHDAESEVCRAIQWPANVYEFSCNEPQTIQLDSCRVALHGQGFERRAENRDLAAKYPAAVPGYFNIGVLHTSLGGSAEHETYAPTSPDVLRGKGYDYWALGHVHTVDPAQPVCNRPFIAYSGNTQGRHIREPGAKGCRLVEVHDGEIVSNEFRATDVLRWQHLRIRPEPDDDVRALAARVEEQVTLALARAEGRTLALRLTVAGQCAAHARLAQPTGRAEAIDDFRYRVRQLSDQVWLEKIEFNVSPVANWEALREAPDLLGYLLRDIRDLSASEGLLRELATELQPLNAKADRELGEAGLSLSQPENLRRWLAAAESLLVSELLEGNE